MSRSDCGKIIERRLSKYEINSLVKGKHLLIAYFKHKFKNYELKGYVKRIK